MTTHLVNAYFLFWPFLCVTSTNYTRRKRRYECYRVRLVCVCMWMSCLCCICHRLQVDFFDCHPPFFSFFFAKWVSERLYDNVTFHTKTNDPEIIMSDLNLSVSFHSPNTKAQAHDVTFWQIYRILYILELYL